MTPKTLANFYLTQLRAREDCTNFSRLKDSALTHIVLLATMLQ
jgi:hypothetical protein